MARAAGLAVVLRGCRRRHGAEPVHRRRPQAEHLPLPACRTARVRGRPALRRRGPRRHGGGLRPHAAQHACGAGGRQPRVRRTRGRGRHCRLASAHHRGGCGRAMARCSRCPPPSATRPRRVRDPWLRPSGSGATRWPRRATNPKRCCARPRRRWLRRPCISGCVRMASRPARSMCWPASAHRCGWRPRPCVRCTCPTWRPRTWRSRSCRRCRTCWPCSTCWHRPARRCRWRGR